jgi:hypothetical protein
MFSWRGCRPTARTQTPARSALLDHLRILDKPATTTEMVVVGRDGEDYENRPALKWQAWPDRLEPMEEGSPAAQ